MVLLPLVVVGQYLRERERSENKVETITNTNAISNRRREGKGREGKGRERIQPA